MKSMKGMKKMKDIKQLIKPLDWRDIEGLMIADTLAYEYMLTYKDNKPAIVYFKLSDQSKARRAATGFNSVEEAKEWAFNHHVEKMSPWLNLVEEL